MPKQACNGLKPSLIVCGESSADRYLSLIVESVWRKEKIPFIAVGGSCLESAGVKLLENFSSISVIGALEVLPKLTKLFSLYNRLTNIIKSGKVKSVILADFPDFNLRIAKAAKKANIPVFYYISPQVWAWRKSRISLISEIVNKLVVILPFEKQLYEKFISDNFYVDYFGHPLIDIIKVKNRADPNKPLLGIFPGSRIGEIKKQLPLFMNIAGILKNRVDNLSVKIAKAPDIKAEYYGKYKNLLLSGDELFANSTAALLKSGTVTLEAAIAGVPGIICYRLSYITYKIGKMIVKGVDKVGLPNIISGKTIYPEFIQNIDPQKAADSLLIYFNKLERDKAVEKIKVVRSLLGEIGVIDRTADELYKFIKDADTIVAND